MPKYIFSRNASTTLHAVVEADTPEDALRVVRENESQDFYTIDWVLDADPSGIEHGKIHADFKDQDADLGYCAQINGKVARAMRFKSIVPGTTDFMPFEMYGTTGKKTIKVLRLLEREYDMRLENNHGFCIHCHIWTSKYCAPDLRKGICQNCHSDGLYGAEELYLQNILEVLPNPDSPLRNL